MSRRGQKKLHLRVYPSTEAPLSERVGYKGDRAEWTPNRIEELSKAIREKRISNPPLMYEHGTTSYDKIGEIKSVFYNEMDKWMHAKCIFDCPKRAAQVTDGTLRGVSLCFAKHLDTNHKRVLEVSLTKDPDFRGAGITVIRSHSAEHPDQYFIDFSAGPAAISKLMSAIDSTPEPQTSVPSTEAALAAQTTPIESAQPAPFTAEKLRAMEQETSLEDRAEAMNRLLQENRAFADEKREREEKLAKEAEDARLAEIEKQREALRPTMERIVGMTRQDMPEDQKREMVDDLVPVLEKSPMLHALLERNFKTEDVLSGQLHELQEQFKASQEEREKAEQFARELQFQLTETRNLIETLDASRQAGLNLSSREIVKSHSRRNPNMSGSAYDKWFASSSNASSSSSSPSSSAENMNTLKQRQKEAEVGQPTNKIIEEAKSMFSLNKGEVIKQHSRGSKRQAEDYIEEPELIGYLRNEGLLGGERAEQKRQKRVAKHGGEQIIHADVDEMVMQHSRKTGNYIESRRERNKNTDSSPSENETRAIVYRQLRNALVEMSEHSVRGERMLTNSLFGTDVGQAVKLLDETYVQRRTGNPDNGRPGTMGVADYPIRGLKDLDALSQHERKNYPEAWFNPTWRAENQRKREEYNRAQGFTVFG